MSSAECFIVLVIVILAVSDACVYVSIKKRLDSLENPAAWKPLDSDCAPVKSVLPLYSKDDFPQA